MPQLYGTRIIRGGSPKFSKSNEELLAEQSTKFERQASVTRIVQNLGRRTLDQRRFDAHLCLFYKIVHGLVAIPLPDYIQYNNRVSRYCHSMTSMSL